MKFLLGIKLGMSQVFTDDGKVIPVTVIEAGPCVVSQIKTKDKDGYEAVQLGFGNKKKISKPLKGHFKNLGNFRYIREYRIQKIPNSKFPVKGEVRQGRQIPKLGDKIDVGVFEEGDKVKVSGISKGKGFQGVVKRWGFHGAPASHGTKHNLRAPGSIGSSFPEKVFKGLKMAGRMGGERVSVKNLKVVKVDPENNLIAVKGAIPGSRGTLVEIRSLE